MMHVLRVFPGKSLTKCAFYLQVREFYRFIASAKFCVYFVPHIIDVPFIQKSTKTKMAYRYIRFLGFNDIPHFSDFTRTGFVTEQAGLQVCLVTWSKTLKDSFSSYPAHLLSSCFLLDWKYTGQRHCGANGFGGRSHSWPDCSGIDPYLAYHFSDKEKPRRHIIRSYNTVFEQSLHCLHIWVLLSKTDKSEIEKNTLNNVKGLLRATVPW